MEDKIWYLSNDFEKKPARDVLRSIIIDDKKNYNKVEVEFKEDIVLLDDAIIQYIEVLRAAYYLREKWKDNNCNRAAIAMLISTLNYVLLARHGIFLGYFPEVRDLLRSCYERTSRCILFFHDKKYADCFLCGEQIFQSEVDKELSKLENDTEKKGVLYKSLREYYSFMSGVTHPNLKSFEARYGDKELNKNVGLQCIFGGIMSTTLGHVVILCILQTVLSVLKILGVMFPEESGEWEKEFDRINSKKDEIYKLFLNI
jgi:hypothetical protein